MSVDDSPAIAEARLAIERALRDFIRAAAAEEHDIKDPIIEGWACAVEYTSVELAQEDKAGFNTIVPNGQTRCLTIGLFASAYRGF